MGAFFLSAKHTKELLLWILIVIFDWSIFGGHADFNHSLKAFNLLRATHVTWCQRRNVIDAESYAEGAYGLIVSNVLNISAQELWREGKYRTGTTLLSRVK